MIDAIANVYGLHNDPAQKGIISYELESGELASRFYKLPTARQDIALRRQMTETILEQVSPMMDRFGDETVTPLFSLWENKELLDRYDPHFHKAVTHWLDKLNREHLFMSSGNTDPKGNRAKQPYQQRDPDLYLRVVKERDDGIVIRGAKFETGAAYAHVAFIKPTVGQWLSENKDYAVAGAVPMNAPGVKMICRPSLPRTSAFTSPISSMFDEIDVLIVFEDVFVPWEDVFLYRSPELASLVRQRLTAWGGHDFLVRTASKANILVGTACLIAEQTGLSNFPGVREKISELMVYSQAIQSFILASEAAANQTEGGLWQPHQGIQNAGRLFASTQFNNMVQILRDLGGGSQIIAPDLKSLRSPEIGGIVEKYFAIENIGAEARARAMHLLSELTSSASAGRMQLYQMFAEGPRMAQSALVYATYDRDKAVAQAAGLAGIDQADIHIRQAG
jgi:4-hydroxyphenylacetate 3-monooxygenase